jgi:hypothetical protein
MGVGESVGIFESERRRYFEGVARRRVACAGRGEEGAGGDGEEYVEVGLKLRSRLRLELRGD